MKNKNYQEQIQEISVDQLLEEDNGIIEISYNQSYQDEYPSISQPMNSFIRDTGLDEITSIKKSSFNLDEEQIVSNQNSQNYRLSQSFSGLNTSVNQQIITQKSKVKMVEVQAQEWKAKQKIRQSKQEQPVYDPKYMQMFNQSIFTDKIGNHNFLPKQKSSNSQEQFKGYQESIYMNNVQAQKSPNKVVKVQIIKQKSIKVIYRPTNYYIQKQSGKFIKSIIIDDQFLRDLYDQFFKKEIFIPLFKENLYEEWNSSKEKTNQESEIHKIFKINIERYVLYINQKYQKQFSAIFDILLELQSNNIKKKAQNQSTFSFFSINALMENIKQYINTSKTQNLRKTLVSKIRAYDEGLRYCHENSEFQKNIEDLTKCAEKVWDELKEVYLLLSLQQTEYYCLKKIENSPEAKFRQIWIKYRQFIKKERHNHINKNLKVITI